MLNLIKTRIGRLYLTGILEGTSLLLLLFIALPFKYLMSEPGLVKAIGPIHGALFVLYVINTLSVSIEQDWKFTEITWKLIAACFIPFGTFYVNRRILGRNSI